jgi:aminoglycoside phosphotransferase (APT) family kinase protein
VHGDNVIVDEGGGAILIDWADAAWGDPAADFGSIPMHDVPHALEGYEEVASLGEGAEARILRAVIGQAVRKHASGLRDAGRDGSVRVPARCEPDDAYLADRGVRVSSARAM